MIANKKVKYSLRSGDRLNTGYNRKSFDRFGDDFCEEILQYLSFDDKIRFECVSKQWMRCVYRRQYVLQTHAKYNNYDLLPVNNLYAFPKRVANNSPNNARITNFERVLMKCPKINCIEVCYHDINETNKLDDLIRIIINNCNDLKSVTVRSNDALGCEISNNTLNDFGTKFGKTLQKIRFAVSIDIDIYNWIQFCPNIVSISAINIKYLISSDLSLTKLSIVKDIKGCEDIEIMKRFVAKYKNTIKVFETYFNGNNCVQFMSQLSQLTNLDKLLLHVTDSVNRLDLINGLKLVAVNCKLKRLTLQLDNHSNNNDNNTELFKVINRFNELKSLRVSSFKTTTESVELIKNCKQSHKKLTELVFEYIYGDEFFKHIDMFLPKLTGILIVSATITDETFNYLSNLLHLRFVVVISRTDTLITHTGLCNLIEKCKNFRHFVFDNCPQITEQTIQVLIEIAKSRPRIKFNHGFGVCSQSYRKMIGSSVQTYGLPSNLKISHKYFDDKSRQVFYFTPR